MKGAIAMWKGVLVFLAVIGVLALVGSVAATGLFAVKTLRPEAIDQGLRREMAAVGVTVGQATEAEITARFGEPEEIAREPLTTLYAYPEQGISLRTDNQSGKLIWYEFTGDTFSTARGVRVGDSYNQVIRTYGNPSTVTPLPRGLRVRYSFGLAYTLEFNFSKDNRVTRVSLSHS